jgi:hypothetical protein
LRSEQETQARAKFSASVSPPATTWNNVVDMESSYLTNLRYSAIFTAVLCSLNY